MLEEYQITRSEEDSPFRKGEKTAPATINKELQCLRATLNKGVDYKKISSNPISTLPQLKEDNLRDRAISYEEFEAFLPHLPQYMQNITLMSYWLGMRQGEVINLPWNNVDLKNRVITLSAKETKEGNKKVIPIVDAVIPMLR
ncbi:MAG: tyrosine-type recombinase/integrase [SAR324 cluster bacterium]|nr:tyrosine-type recombinase/integrase [SAR324 cluster bacterium]